MAFPYTQKRVAGGSCSGESEGPPLAQKGNGCGRGIDRADGSSYTHKNHGDYSQSRAKTIHVIMN